MSKYWKCTVCSKTYGPQQTSPTCTKKECHNAPCAEIVVPPIKGGQYRIQDVTLDKDMQLGLAKVPFAQAQKMVEDAKVQALKMVNDKLDHEKVKETLDMHHFHATKWATDHHGCSVPCEWKHELPPIGHGATPLVVSVMLDIDDIPPGATVNGPDRPHVGWMVIGKGQRAFKYTGHVFVDKVHVSRNTD